MSTAQAIVVAIAGAAILSLVVTIVLARLALRRWDKEVERQRTTAALLLDNQETVAARAVEVADRLRESNEKIAEAVTATTSVTLAKLAEIHTLVNSGLTASVQAELDATRRYLASMREVVALRQGAGDEPSPEAIATMRGAESRIAELEAELSDRAVQADLVAKQQRELEQ